LRIEDISVASFDPSLYGRSLSELMGTLHGVFPDGSQTRGVETFREAYRAVGLGWILAPTGWPILRPLCNGLYFLFARYRVHLGNLFGRQCEGDRCALPQQPPQR
jgi:predicted DCC family thiol-disulfide oxidoreductase YuxK